MWFLRARQDGEREAASTQAQSVWGPWGGHRDRLSKLSEGYLCVRVKKKQNTVQSFKNNILKKKILVCQRYFPQMIRDVDRWSF